MKLDHAGKRAQRTSLLAAVLVLLLAAYVGLHFRASTDITHLLPTAEDQRLATIARQLADSQLSRTLVLSIAGKDAQQARAGAQAMATILRQDKEVAWLHNGPTEGMGKAFYQVYFRHRLGLLSRHPERDLAPRLTDAGLARAAHNLKRQLGLPMAALTKRVAPGDPLLSFPAWLTQLDAARPQGLIIEDGQFMARDGQHALILLGSRHSAMDFDHQSPLLARILGVFAQVQTKMGPELRLQKTGIHRHAVAARRRIEADVQRISVVSTLAIILLFIFLFRSVSLLLLGLVPLLVGVLSGVAVILATAGQIHGLTLTFGATLIGVCLDYPVHLFNHHSLSPDRSPPLISLRRVWPGLLLGAITTITGFAGLALSNLPAIREVALFASVGIGGALLATRFLVAPWLPSRRVRAQQVSADALARLLALLRRRRRLLLAVPMLAVVVGIAGLPGLQWRDDIKALTRQDPTLQAEDAAVRAQLSAHESGRVVVVVGKDIEAALQADGAMVDILLKAQKDGVLGGFRSVHSLLWSADLQRRNRAVLAASPNLSQRMNTALSDVGFRASLFAPFATALAKPAAPLTWAELANSPLAELIAPFRIQAGSETGQAGTKTGQAGYKTGLLLFVRDVHDPVALAQRVKQLDGAVFFDQQAFMNQTFGSHRRGALLLLLLGLLAVIAVVALRYRDVRRTIVAAAPALLAGFFTVGVLSLFGWQLNLLHLVSLVLVLSMGVDYGVFLAESVDHPAGQAATLLSIVIACLSTVLGFGLLAMSSNPALRAIGLTTGIGVLASLCLAPAVLLLVEAKPTATSQR